MVGARTRLVVGVTLLVVVAACRKQVGDDSGAAADARATEGSREAGPSGIAWPANAPPVDACEKHADCTVVTWDGPLPPDPCCDQRVGYYPMSCAYLKFMEDFRKQRRVGDRDSYVRGSVSTGAEAEGARARAAHESNHDAALGALGLRRVVQLPENDGSDGIGYGVDYPVFRIDRFHPSDVKQHTAFVAKSRGEGDAFHAAALRDGGKGPPGLRDPAMEAVLRERCAERLAPVEAGRVTACSARWCR